MKNDKIFLIEFNTRDALYKSVNGWLLNLLQKSTRRLPLHWKDGKQKIPHSSSTLLFVTTVTCAIPFIGLGLQ